MPLHPLKRVEDRLRDVAQLVDYGLYLVFNPFKFKRFPTKIKRILVVETLQLGDLLVATPVFRALKQHYKSAAIDVLVQPPASQLLEGNTSINTVIPFTSFADVLSHLRENKYDLGILLHPASLQMSWLLFRAGVQYRVGATKAGFLSGKGFFLHKKIKPTLKMQHKIQDNLDVLRALPILVKDASLELPVHKKAAAVVATFMKHFKSKTIILHTSSKHKSHHWMPERFARLADILVHKYKATIFFTGTKEDHHHVHYIISQMRQPHKAHNLAGRTTLPQLIALVDAVDLVVTIDTSMTHIASARKTPVVVLFGPTMPAFWGPSSKNSRYLWKDDVCVGCRRSFCIYGKNYICMRFIYESDVLAKIAEVFP
ncbi:glycosyltransferase family 9 protein [Candidatus Woesearchaeota archaeon]|nr:glycosyltransferase family 9 protein [Candidatus Woesearchaeota archaeon]